MNILSKSLLLSLTAAALTVASLSPASADDRWRHGGGWNHNGGYHGGYNGGYHGRHDGWGHNGWGIAGGLAGGLLLGSVLASQPTYYNDGYAPPVDDYYAPPRRVIYAAPPAPVYYRQSYAGALQPWSPQWRRYCEGRYRTFDERSGTFIGNDGSAHFCVAS